MPHQSLKRERVECVFVCACNWYHLVLQKQYELRCILNAAFEKNVTVQRKPYTSVNNA